VGVCQLDIHGYKDGQKTFRAATRYDWYILHNVDRYTTTSICDEEGKIFTMDLSGWQFIPNFAFNEVKQLLGSQDYVEVLYSRSIYGTDKRWMSKENNSNHSKPCVYMLNRKNEATFWYCNEKKDFFVPKVIFASGATGFIVDSKGEYGLTQFATGIVDSVENLPMIAKALDSPRFKRIVEATSMSKAEIDRKILALFRKDFWKEFV
jgi:hypothetical protein